MRKAAPEGTLSAFLGSCTAGKVCSRHAESSSGSHAGAETRRGADAAPSVILHFADGRINHLQQGNDLNKGDFSFAGMTGKRSQEKRIFGGG